MTCNQACRLIASFYGSALVTTVSVGCNSDIFSSMTEDEGFPSFSRVVPPWTFVAKVTAKLAKYYEWKRIAIITSSSQDWVSNAFALQTVLTENGIYTDTNYTLHSQRIEGSLSRSSKVYIEAQKILKALTNPKASVTYYSR